MKEVLCVFIGGGVGSTFRYLVSLLFARELKNSICFFAGTFLVNLLGSFLIGLFLVWFSKQQQNSLISTSFIVGFCGGFTTFSTLSRECLQLLRGGEYITLILYSSGTLLLGILAVFLGMQLGKRIL